MKLNIQDEFSPLKSVVVCWGDQVQDYSLYQNEDPEFTKFHPYSWDRDLMLKQQEVFFKLLEKYGVKLIFPKTKVGLGQQMYTRDTAFIVGSKLYHSTIRKFVERNGEVELLLQALDLNPDQIVAIEHEIEGGDVLVNGQDGVFVGFSSRTSKEAIETLKQNLEVRTFRLGQYVMHLDTRLTLLPNKVALVNTTAFIKEDLDFINQHYQIIPVTNEESKKLGTNVFVINPETIVAPKEHPRVAKLLETHGFNVEIVDYTEPINLGGSFRCTTMPLERSYS